MRRLLRAVVALAVVFSGIRSGDAARLVVLAVDSGIDTTSPYINFQPPNIGPGTKGFLIGIDLEDGLQDVALGVQNLQFTNVVHQQGQLDDTGNPLSEPLNIKTRSVAQLQEVIDGVVSNGYRRSDTYVMDNPQQGSYVWTPVAQGFEGGAPGDTYFRVTGSLGLPSQIDGGLVQFVYLVTTGDVQITGIIARGATGFGPAGGPVGEAILLDYDTGMAFPYNPPSNWINPAGGSFGVGSNWSNGVPNAGNEANFEMPATYTVSFGFSTTNKYLTVRHGDVTLDLNGFTYQLTADPLQEETTSVKVFGGLESSAALRVIDGNLNSTYASIGFTYFTESGAATIGSGATWTNSGDFYVGSNTSLSLGGLPCQLLVEDGGALIVGQSLRVDSGSTITLLDGTIDAGGFQIRTTTSTLRIGLGGTDAGEFGQLSVAGIALLAGTFDIDLLGGFMPALGDTFEVMTFGSRVGDFASYTGLNVGGHLALQHIFTANSLILKAMPAADGDANLDGVVDIFDVNYVSSNWDTSGPQGDVNGDGTVDIFDVNTISANWGATDPSGAQAVPEPASMMLLCLGGLVVATFVYRGRAS